jgi:hypothetical protein
MGENSPNLFTLLGAHRRYWVIAKFYQVKVG